MPKPRSSARGRRRSATRCRCSCTSGSPRPVRGHLRVFRPQRASVLDARVSTTRHGYALDNFIVTQTESDAVSRHRESRRAATRVAAHRNRTPEPSKGRLSRLSRTFPITPRVDLRADERGTTSCPCRPNRPGLLFDRAYCRASDRRPCGADQYARRTRRGHFPARGCRPVRQPPADPARNRIAACDRSLNESQRLCAPN